MRVTIMNSDDFEDGTIMSEIFEEFEAFESITHE